MWLKYESNHLKKKKHLNVPLEILPTTGAQYVISGFTLFDSKMKVISKDLSSFHILWSNSSVSVHLVKMRSKA